MNAPKISLPYSASTLICISIKEFSVLLNKNLKRDYCVMFVTFEITV